MSNKLKCIREESDLVFKELHSSIDVFIITKNNADLYYLKEDIKYVTKEIVDKALSSSHGKKISVLSTDGDIIAINYIRNM
jgi:hypothetical protein